MVRAPLRDFLCPANIVGKTVDMSEHDVRAAAALGEALSALREERRKRDGLRRPRSFGRMSGDIREMTGEEITDENIRKAHIGKSDPNNCSIRDLILIARWYDVPPSALGPVVRDRAERELALLGGRRNRRSPARGQLRPEHPLLLATAV